MHSEGPHLRLDGVPQQARCACRDPQGARRAAATPVAGKRDHARTHFACLCVYARRQATHRDRYHLLPSLRQRASDLYRRTSPRSRRPHMNTCVLAQQTPLQRAPRERASGAMPRHRKTGIKRPSLKLFDMCEHVHKALPRLSMGYEPQQNDQPTDGLSNPIALSPRPTAVLARRSASREGGSVQQHFIPCAAFVFLPSFFCALASVPRRRKG